MQSNNQTPEVPPRATNYPIQQNQNIWNNIPNARPPPANGQMFNNRPPINNGRPVVPQRTVVSSPNQNQNIPMQRPPVQNMQRSPIQNIQKSPPPIPQRSVHTQYPTPAKQTSPNQTPNLPQPRQNIRNQPTNLPINQLSNTNIGSNTQNSNIQINSNQNIQQRRNYSQKDVPVPPAVPRKSNGSVSRASSIKTKFVDIVNRSLSRKKSTRQNKAKKLNSYGGMNVHSAYRNSLLAKPIFDSKILLKPQNPNFILSLGSVFMIASVSLAIAFVALNNGGLTEKKIHDISSEDSFGFIFFSVFMLLIGLTGYVAYHKKWTSLLITYSVFLIFGFIVQIIVIILFLNIYFHPLVQMRYKWIDVLSDSEKQTIQEVYQCCGYLSVVDHGLTTTMCMPDTASTTLTIKSSMAMRNTFNYLDPQIPNKLSKRQDDTNVDPAQQLKEFYKSKDPESYTESDIKDEGCARIIVNAIKSGLLQYIIIETVMALLFIVAFYFAVMHFKEQLNIEKEIDSARATFG